MDRLFRYAIITFTISMALFAAAKWQGTHRTKPELEKMAKRIEKKLAANNEDFLKVANDRLVLNDLISNTFNSKEYDAIAKKPYSFLMYMNGELLVWNSNQNIPPNYLATAVADGNSFLKLDNGYFEIMKVTIKVRNLDLAVIGLSLVRSNYRIENRYLHSSFNPSFGVPDYVTMSLGQGTSTVPVKDPSGATIFQLKVDETKAPARFDNSVLILTLLASVLLLLSINIVVYRLAITRRSWVGFMLLIGTLVGLRALMLALDYPSEFLKLDLFNPKYFASSAINRSLGDLLINTILAFNIIFVFFALVPFPRHRFKGKYYRYSVVLVAYLVLSILAYSIGILFNNLLLNSNIPFDLNNFMSLTVYTFVGLIIISIVLFSYLLITYKVLKRINKFALPVIVDFGLIFISLLIFLGYLFLSGATLVFFATAAWMPLYLLFLRREVRRKRDITSFTHIIVIIILFSMLSSVHVYQYNREKDLEQRRLVARKLADQRNRVTEYLFSDIQNKILNDPFIRSYFLTPFIATNEIQKRIRQLYFGGYFSKYDLDIYLINKQGQPLQPVDAEFYALEDPNAELSPPSEFLYFIPKAGGSYLYFSNLPIQFQNKFIGTIILKFSPKSYSKTNLYPELLLEESIKPPDEGSIYSYGIYQNEHLVRKEGLFPYGYQLNMATGKSDYNLIQQGGFDHLVYSAGDNKVVVVTSKSDSWLQPVTLFSYLFCFYLLFAFVGVQLRTVVRLMRQEILLNDLFNLSFKDKIQYSMISLLVIAFLIIGIITVANFTSQYDEYNQRNLVNKQTSIKTAIEYGLKDNPSFLNSKDGDTLADGTDAKKIDLASLSDVHAMDVNIYNQQGDIINTSQPDIFSKGLQADKMDPQAFKYVVVDRHSQFIHNEMIGSLKYMSIYVPLNDNEGHVMGYLNLPYFAKEKELRGELSAFLITLVNVYVFLLVLGGFFAYLLSNSITSPLTIISDKLKFIQFGRKNEPIEWRGDDEIGKLVSEYNKMIGELESSAELLARSERESAWREMAKQVAHEIKNPLTPMKLSIQHLQRAMAEGRPGVEQLANRVSNTLIEQIDNLNHIASEFSSFAKMPTVNNEVFDIAEVVSSVVDLFNGENGAIVTCIGADKQVWVYADKNQLLRGFNNLVKNATQAIPDDRVGEIVVRVEVKTTEVLIELKDNGTGISDELRPKVFVPNFTTKGSGTGLGLAITRQIVESAGGEIWFYSTENIGTTFFVKLPLYMKPVEHER